MSSAERPSNYDMSVRDAQTARDFLPEEQYPASLPPREKKHLGLSKIINNRIFQLGMAILLCFAIIAGAWVLGMVLGKKDGAKQAPREFFPITTTPPVKTVDATRTISHVLATVTTTPTVTTTVFIAPARTHMGNSGERKENDD